MKPTFLFFLLFAGVACTAHAGVCENAVSKRVSQQEGLDAETFISSEYYFEKVVRAAFDEGTRPHSFAKRRGLTVVTEGIREMFSDPTTLTGRDDIYVVKDTTNFFGKRLDMDAEIRKLRRRYKVDFEKEMPHFGTNWTTYKVSGGRADLLNFLRNAAGIIWSGLRYDSRFVKRARKYFSRSEIYRNESWD